MKFLDSQRIRTFYRTQQDSSANGHGRWTTQWAAAETITAENLDIDTTAVPRRHPQGKWYRLNSRDDVNSLISSFRRFNYEKMIDKKANPPISCRVDHWSAIDGMLFCVQRVHRTTSTVSNGKHKISSSDAWMTALTTQVCSLEGATRVVICSLNSNSCSSIDNSVEVWMCGMRNSRPSKVLNPKALLGTFTNELRIIISTHSPLTTVYVHSYVSPSSHTIVADMLYCVCDSDQH